MKVDSHERGGGSILALICQEPDDFCKRHCPFERGSRGEKSKIKSKVIKKGTVGMEMWI
jgi:hypothetical protein